MGKWIDTSEEPAETEWQPVRHGLFWIVERRMWSDFLGSAYQVHKYKNGVWRRFWTKTQAQVRANDLNNGYIWWDGSERD